MSQYGKISEVGRLKKLMTVEFHFYTAMLDRAPIAFIANELVGCGRIQEITENRRHGGRSAVSS